MNDIVKISIFVLVVSLNACKAEKSNDKENDSLKNQNYLIKKLIQENGQLTPLLHQMSPI